MTTLLRLGHLQFQKIEALGTWQRLQGRVYPHLYIQENSRARIRNLFFVLRQHSAIKSHKIEENVDGYSSFEKEPLARKIKKEKKNPDEYIIQKNIKTYSLESVYSEFNGNFDNVDFLQIDAEGYDDEVIYNSSLENKKYKYINYEFKYFSEERLKKLHNYLHLNNYKIIRWKKSDELAYKENSI